MKSSGEVAAGLALIGAVASVFVYRKTSNKTTTCGLLFFVSSMCLMSFLYIYSAKNVFDHSELAISAGTCNDDALAQLDKCETFENKFLSLLSFSCFCFQPYVYHLVISEGVQSSVIKGSFFCVHLFDTILYKVKVLTHLNFNYHSCPSYMSICINVHYHCVSRALCCSD